MVKRRRQHHAGVKMVILMAGAAICLSGCGDDQKSSGVDPIEWYRDLSGDSRNDLKDKAAANSKNLEQGSKMPYPNLASVPKEPNNAITKADREKMAQSLIADRTNAQYTDEQLRAGQNLEAVAPPLPETPVTTSPKVAAATATTLAAPPPTAAPNPPASATSAAIGAAPPPAPTTAPKVAAAPAQPVKQEPLPPAPTTSKGQQMAAIPSAAPPATERTADAAPSPAQPPKKSDAKKKQVKRGSEQPPEESSLRSPTIAAMPKGEEAQEPPPPPVDTPSEGKRAARSPRTEEVAAATPTHGDIEAGKSQRDGGQTVEIKFTPGPARDRIPEAERNRLVQVARLVERNNNSRVRIVGYAGAPAQGDKAQREFQSFNAALDNAKAVGIELAKLGVPPSRIDIETKANAGSADRAEIFVEY
jgi:hypothetical protein